MALLRCLTLQRFVPSFLRAAFADRPTPKGRQRVIAYVAVSIGMMVAALNMTVVSAALPRIAADLKGLDHFHWVFTGYIVTAAASLPIFGKLSDMYGRKLFFSIGLIILMIGSALSGIAQDIFQLSIFRALAGIGAGALIANSMSIVGELFTPKEQPKWRALNQGVFAISNICGPLVGGLLTDHLSWRWVFFMNIPVAASALVYASFVLPPFYYRGRRHRIDFLGAALLLAFVIPLLVGVSLGGRQLPWGSWQVVGLLSASGVMAAAFLAQERRAPEPILPLPAFKNGPFAISNLVYLLIGLGLFGTMLNLPLFVQGVAGRTATESGLFLMPMTISSFFAGVIAGQLLSRWGRYKVVAIFSTATATLGIYLLSTMDASATRATITLYVVIMGMGMGVAFPLFMVIATNAVPQRMLGVATSSAAFMRNFGGTIGVAVMGTMVGSRFASGFHADIPAPAQAAMERAGVLLPTNPQALLDADTVANIENALIGAGGVQHLPVILDTMRASLASAIGDSFLLGAFFMGIAVVACLFLREVPLRTSNDPEPEDEGTRPPAASRT